MNNDGLPTADGSSGNAGELCISKKELFVSLNSVEYLIKDRKVIPPANHGSRA